ncbi:hypothetical protein [Niabella aquatica]
MRKILFYEDVIRLLRESESDDFIQQGILLLSLVHEAMAKNTLQKDDFIFTQFEEGHILVTDIKKTARV